MSSVFDSANQYSETFERAKKTLLDIESRYRNIFEEFKDDCIKHSKSKNSLPNVGKNINDNRTRMSEALKIIHEAMFNAQELTNKLNLIWGIKLTELMCDADTVMRSCYNTFMECPTIQGIKTSAEKERQYSSQAKELLDIKYRINSMSNSCDYLSSYVKSLVFDLGKYQSLIENMDRMRSRELWSSELSQNSVLSQFEGESEEEFTDDQKVNKAVETAEVEELKFDEDTDEL